MVICNHEKPVFGCPYCIQRRGPTYETHDPEVYIEDAKATLARLADGVMEFAPDNVTEELATRADKALEAFERLEEILCRK